MLIARLSLPVKDGEVANSLLENVSNVSVPIAPTSIIQNDSSAGCMKCICLDSLNNGSDGCPSVNEVVYNHVATANVTLDLLTAVRSVSVLSDKGPLLSQT